MTLAVRELWHDFAVQRQVIGGIMMREMMTRWGRRNLGFAWLFLEPLVFAFPVIAVWSMIRAPFEHGLPMVAFVWTGYMPILIFRHVTGGAIGSMRGAAALLYHRRVTPLDLFLGRQGLEALGNLASVVVSFVLLYVIGSLDWPYDYSLMFLGFVYTAWWSLCVALMLAALSERYEIIVHLWSPISYLYIFYSGFFMLADWIPARWRGIVMAIDPPLHCYEMVRAGLFGNRMHPHYDIGYLTVLLAVLTLFGLWLMRDVRQHLELE
jgi:capsular polysaccharide transport system permease protein